MYFRFIQRREISWNIKGCKTWFSSSNQTLIERFEIQDKIDHMEFGKINYHTEWLVGEMGEIGKDGEPLEEDLVHEDDDLTWSELSMQVELMSL